MFESNTLRGSSFSILGDSYSTFEGHIPADYLPFYPRLESVSDVTSFEDTWWYKFANQNQMKLLVNNSFSGSTVCEQVRDGLPLTSAFSVRARECSFSTPEGAAPDYLFVFGCTNDCWLGRSFGDVQFECWSSESLQKVLPAYCYVLHHLTQRYPNTTLVTVANDELNSALKEGMRHASNHYGSIHVTLKDIDKQSGHPTAHGMSQIAMQIQVTICSMRNLSRQRDLQPSY